MSNIIYSLGSSSSSSVVASHQAAADAAAAVARARAALATATAEEATPASLAMADSTRLGPQGVEHAVMELAEPTPLLRSGRGELRGATPGIHQEEQITEQVRGPTSDSPITAL